MMEKLIEKVEIIITVLLLPIIALFGIILALAVEFIPQHHDPDATPEEIEADKPSLKHAWALIKFLFI